MRKWYHKCHTYNGNPTFSFRGTFYKILQQLSQFIIIIIKPHSKRIFVLKWKYDFLWK